MLGRKIIDKITGFDGVIVAKMEVLNGRPQYLVESTRGDTGNGLPSEPVGLHEGRLKIRIDPPNDNPIIPVVEPETCNIELGATVRDKVTSYEGIAVAKTTCANGNVLISIQSTELYEGLPLPKQSFHAGRVEAVQKSAKPLLGSNIPSIQRPSMNQAMALFEKLRGVWWLKTTCITPQDPKPFAFIAKDHERTEIDLLGNIYIGTPDQGLRYPLCRLTLLSCDDTLTNVELARQEFNGKTIRVEVLQISQNEMRGYVKHDEKPIIYFRN